jgi:sec-independent protein translocase protein TatA
MRSTEQWRTIALVPFNIGGPELMFILVIVLIVFGAGRLPEVFGQLGKGIRTFRDESASTAPPTIAAPAAATTCAKCQAVLPPASKFCPSCGAAV